MQRASGRKLDFMVVGVQKAGTTALDYALRQHPAIALPSRKEIHFFDGPPWLFALPGALRDYIYHRKFPAPADGVLRGEITPSYMYWEPAPRRIARYSSKIRLIAILRDPVDRAFSHYWMERNRGWEQLQTFEEAVEAEMHRLKRGDEQQDKVRSYLDRGLYSIQIARLQKFFPSSQLLFLRYDDWRLEPQRTLDALTDHLGIARMIIDDLGEVFRGQYESMGRRTRQMLSDYYSADVERTQQLTGLDLSAWMRR